METTRTAASAPNKIIIAGEHSVVYGGKSLCAPVQINGKRNRAIATIAAGSGKVTILTGRQRTYFHNGKPAGERDFYPVLAAVDSALKKHCQKEILTADISVALKFSGSPKGTGNSASISACAISAACAALGKTLSQGELYDAVMVAENQYHGGKASGLDPMTVCSDKPILFRKVFSKKGISLDYSQKKLELPAGCRLFLVDSDWKGRRATTAELIGAFAKANKIECAPDAVTSERRKSLIAPFDMLVDCMEEQLHKNGDAQKLGELFDENHALLSCFGVSAHSIERVRKIAMKAGALGSKLTGAGGTNGGVLVLANDSDAESIKAQLTAADFTCFEIEFSQKGAGLD